MKDTKASKRITDHRSRYLKAIKRLQHQAEPGEPTGEDKPTAEISTHALKVTFQALWGVAEIEDQRRTLVDLYMKVGVTAETLLKWSNGELLGLATSALSKGAIDVPHRAVS